MCLLFSQMNHRFIVERDEQEIFLTEGDVVVHVPKVEGHLRLRHAGSLARHHFYALQVSPLYCSRQVKYK